MSTVCIKRQFNICVIVDLLFVENFHNLGQVKQPISFLSYLVHTAFIKAYKSRSPSTIQSEGGSLEETLPTICYHASTRQMRGI